MKVSLTMFSFEFVPIIILYLFVGATVIQLLYWLFVFRSLAKYKEPISNTTKAHKVSVIICARNEEENLKENLPRILNQNYRSFELIVVNDDSNDRTADVLLNFAIKHPILHVLNRHKQPGMPGKKQALSQGIHTAKHDVLLHTDADCQPASNDWLHLMQSKIAGSIKIGLGYAPYVKQPGWLNRFIRFETVYTAVQYLSFALCGKPYMGVGRNLIYHKSLFQKVNGFTKHQNIASGDDDLFINQIANNSNTSIVLNKNTFVYSPPAASWKQFYRQKSRHYTTGKHYKLQHQLALGLLSMSHFLHYFGGIVLIILKFSTFFVALLYLVRMTVILMMYRRILKQLDEQDLLSYIPLLDAIFVFHYLIFTPALVIGKTYQWK